MINHLTKIIFMTFIIANTLVFAQQIESENYLNCGKNAQAIKLAQLIIESDNQQRTELICHKKLAEIAEIKAKSMAVANKIKHRIDYTTPNQLLRKHGIVLPKNYLLFDNQVESIMGAVKTAQDSFDVFMTSPDHKIHLLGEKDFLLKQNHIGVGFFKDDSTKYVYHWVV